MPYKNVEILLEFFYFILILLYESVLHVMQSIYPFLGYFLNQHY
nr:MAG TPA: hypothetical protein [Caudoviricetes sp.]